MKRTGLLVVLAMLVVPSMAIGGSLADAAKKEKERREKNKESGVTAVRTITQDDVSTDDSAAKGDEASGNAASSQPSSSYDDGGSFYSSYDSSRRSSGEESVWRNRAKYARERVDSARQRLARTPSRVTRYSTYPYHGYFTTDNPDYAYAEQELKQAEKALSDLEDEARRSGALPGWLR